MRVSYNSMQPLRAPHVNNDTHIRGEFRCDLGRGITLSVENIREIEILVL